LCALLVLLCTGMSAPGHWCVECYKKYFIHNDQLPVQ